MKISIITVVFNGIQNLESTIISVLDQSYKNIEYIIIDGNSTDGTLDLIKKYDDFLTLWISEPDNGIYDAMNKGIRYATGDYIHFLNVGDTFYFNDTLQNVFNKGKNFDVIYGNTCIKHAENETVLYTYPLHFDWKTIPYCHQSVFIKRNLLVNIGFDLNYKVASDFNQYHVLKKLKASFLKIDEIICIYDNYGFSSQNVKLMLREYAKISYKNSASFFSKIRIIIYFYLKSILIKN